MSGHHPNPSVDNEAQFGRIVANLFREDGWKVLEEPREKNVAPDFLVSGHGKKLVVELKRASEGRKDRVIPLLSQAALEAIHYSRVIPGHPVPLAIVGANRIPNSIAEDAKQFIRDERRSWSGGPRRSSALRRPRIGIAEFVKAAAK